MMLMEEPKSFTSTFDIPCSIFYGFTNPQFASDRFYRSELTAKGAEFSVN